MENWAMITNGQQKSWINLDRISRIHIASLNANDTGYSAKFYIYADGEQLPVPFSDSIGAEHALQKIGIKTF